MRLAIVAVMLAAVSAAWADEPVRVSVALGPLEGGQMLARGEGIEAVLAKPEFVAQVAGRTCWTIPASGEEARYLYVRVTDPRLKDGSMAVKVWAEVLDQPGVLQIDYDSYLFPWKSQSVQKGDTGQWKRFVFELPDATFINRCNGWDLRFASDQAMSIAAIGVELVGRTIAPEGFNRDWSVARLSRTDLARCGFAHGGVFWGPGGMTRDIYEKELDLTSELGFGWMRYWPEWAMLEPKKGEFDWTLSDYMVSEAKKRGIKMVGLVAFDTMWAADAPDEVTDWSRTKYPPRNLKDLSDYVYALVSRYKDDVKYWEGWNEQNAVGAFWLVPPSGRDPVEHYVAWQRTFYEAAKKADPQCVVLTGGFADGVNLMRELIGYYEKGLKGTFDAMNIHSYGKDPREHWVPGQIEGVIRVMRHFGDGDKKIWITETGWPVEKHPYSVTPAQQAQWAPWQLAVLLSYPQVERAFFYQLRDTTSNDAFGWYHFDFVARPVVAAWKEFLKTMPSTDGQ